MHAFMTIKGLLKGGQKSIHCTASHVPSSILSTINELPRILDGIHTMSFKLKRKALYNTIHFLKCEAMYCSQSTDSDT